MTLREIVERARNRGEVTEVALFAAVAPRDTRRAALLLATSVALQPSAFESLMLRLWPDSNAAESLQSLARWPFIDCGIQWSVLPPFGAALADDFRLTEPESWMRAHRLMADAESAALDPTAALFDVPRWYAEGRIAYHEAAFDPAASVKRFGDIFTSPPHGNPDGARRWLTALARRQETALVSRPRESAFFRAYDVYASGVATKAIDELTTVYEPLTPDPYAAFALYLAGVITGLSRPDLGLEMLESSIALSQELDLPEPEIRARHSWVWTSFGLINAAVSGAYDEEQLLRQAQHAANLNLSRAERYGSRLLIARSKWTAIVASWLLAADWETDEEDALREQGLRAVEELQHVRDMLFENGDPRGAILTTKDAMSILARLGAIDDAIDQVDVAVKLAQSLEAPASLGRVTDELERVADRADAYQRDRIDSLLREIRIMVGPGS